MTIRVLYLAPPRRSEGRITAFTFVDEEVLALADAGIRVFVLTYPSPDGTVYGHGVHPNLQLRVLPSGKSLRELATTLLFLWRVRRLIPAALWRQPAWLYHLVRIERFAADVVRTDRIDVIHSNFGWPEGFGGILAGHASATPVVATMRGMDVICDQELDYGLRLTRHYETGLRTLLTRADKTTHVSDFIRDLAIGLGAPEDRAVTVRKGVDCDGFSATAHGGAAGARPRILAVAGLIRRKGIDVVLRALAELVPDHDFEFVVAGDGPEREALEKLAAALGLQSRTSFRGYVGRDKIAELFASSDIFVLGSIWEGSGNVLLEALASGCPVVCTQSGGPPEYIEDGVSGFVVPVNDPPAMAAAFGKLLGDADLRQAFGRNARKQAVERYRYSRMINDIIAVYRSVTAWPAPDAAGVPIAGSLSGFDTKAD